MLPRFVIESRTTYHTSSRQPKRSRPDWIKDYYRSMYNNKPRIRAEIHGASAPIVSNTRLSMSRTGPLNLNEYRFWRASEGTGRCRHCLQTVGTPKERMAHQKEKGCTRVLVGAYKLLLRDKKCVVCDAATNHTKWGVPLCSTTCVCRWQFEVGAGAYTVQLATKLVEYQQQGGLKF